MKRAYFYAKKFEDFFFIMVDVDDAHHVRGISLTCSVMAYVSLDLYRYYRDYDGRQVLE